MTTPMLLVACETATAKGAPSIELMRCHLVSSPPRLDDGTRLERGGRLMSGSSIVLLGQAPAQEAKAGQPPRWRLS